jgi:hypothetical protein
VGRAWTCRQSVLANSLQDLGLAEKDLGGCKKKWWQPEKLSLQWHIPAWMLKTLSNLYPELVSQVNKKKEKG